MILEILRRTYATLRKFLPTSISWVLVLSLFVAIPSQVALSSTANAAACSPTTSSVNGETLLVFSTIGNCTWTVPSDITNVELLVVGGGGSGSAGIANIYWPGGGGGGGVETRSGFAVTPGSTISVTTGSGGEATASRSGATGNNGTASSFGSITANGGLTPNNTATANAGAKGGTSGNGNLGATGTANGINCGASLCGTGGGGGSEAAGSGLNGGSGITSSITGTAVGYGGGGAGGNGASGTASDGGAVGYYATTSASATGNAAANTGGGGARNASGYGGAGGSGVVIVRYIAIAAGSSVLRFDSNGGSGSKDTQVLTTGSTATAPTISGFSKSGSFFTAWNTAADGSGTSYRPGATFTLTGNALLYAQWQATTFLGTTYSATEYSFGGGSNSGVVDCAAGNVLVGAAFQQNPMNVANYCVPLLSDLTVAPLSSSVRATSNYVFCPDGMVAIGYKYISGVKLGLQCKTPPGLSDTVEETSFITASTKVSRGATAYSGSSMCNAGDVVVGFSRSWNLWLDSHGARCAPFAKYNISYNANGSVTTVPTTTTQSIPQERLTVASYSGVRTGYHFSGWNTANTGLGSDYAVGLEIAPGGNTALFAKWTSTITYDSNSATSGTAPSATVAAGTQAQTLLATNSGTLAKTGYTFAGWNTAADGSGTNYAAGLTTYSSPGDITLYAQWNSTITYSANSANGGTAPASQTAIGQKPLTLQTNSGSLTRTGYTFAGWNTAADGSGTRYAAGATSYVSSGNATLYAYWLPAPGIPVFQQSSDSGSSNTDYITNDSTPEVSASGLVVGASVTITAYNSANTAIGSCTFTATSTTQSCSISTALPSENYYFRATQSLYGFTTPISANSTPVVKINTVLPTAYVITVGSNSTISWKNTQTGQVSVNATGTAYLVRSTVNVSDINSITSADGSLWNSVSITSANVATNIALTGLLGGTYKAYAVDVAGNLSLASASSMLVYSQANAATDLVATPGVGSMGPKFDLTWTAPTDNGGGIDSYLIQYSNDSGTTWVSYQRNANPGTTYSVYPVNYETDYIFRISAVNLWGNGTTSTSSEVKRVAIPSCSPATSPNGFTLVFPVGVCAWTVPTGVTSIKVDARGAQGGWGDYAPGSGGQVIGTLTVTPGETLYMYVGDQGSDKGTSTNPLLGRGGFNGGGFGGQGGAVSGGMNGAGGGGATDIRTTINIASSRVVVSGGGGGTTYQGNSCCRNIGGGGNGGGTTGAQTTTSDGSGGGGGTQSAGGYSYGAAAGAGFGGAGEDPTSPSALGGGGGGSGYYGGGGGGGPWRTGGGGGSSYVSNSRFTSTTNSQGVNCAPGFLAITIGNDTSQVPPLPNTCGATADTTPPVVSTVSPPTVNAAGSIITIIYTDVNFLNTNYVPSSLFTVTSGGSRVTISSITFMNKVLYLNLAQNLKPGATTTISYTDATSGNDIYVVQDAFGNDAPSFTNISIATNAITVATPTTPVLAAASDTGSSNTDKNTNDNTPTFSSSSLVVGATVTFTATPTSGTAVTCVKTVVATTDTCTFSTLPDSTYSIAVKQTSGTVTSGSPAPLIGVQIDTARPTVALTSTAIVSGGNSLATPAAPSNNYNITATFSEVVNDFVITDITKNVESTGWSISTPALSTSALSAYTFNVINSTGAGNAAGKLYLSIAEGVASDLAGNTNAATTSSFIINTIIQLTLTNQYQAGISPVVGGNNATVVQASNGASVDLTGQGGVTRANHTFAGWSLVTTSGSGAVIPSPYTPTVPLFLYSSWIPNVYVVSFDANGGTGAIDSATVNYTYGTTGLAITSTYNKGTLAKTGYTFAGWSATVGGAAVANPYVPTGSITLSARWTANTYAITFDSNTATSGTMNNLGITAGDRIALWGNLFVKTGFTFTGWNSAANGKGTPYGEAAFVTLYGNTTLYAQWKVLTPGTPTITSVSAGNTSVVVTVAGAGISGSAGAVDSFTVQAYNDAGTLLTGKTCTVLATASPLRCTISGLTNGEVYKFKTTAFNSTGSRDNGSGFSSTATPAPYTVIYNINGGTSGAISNGSYNLGTPLTLPTPSRTSYTFVGWYDTTTAGTLIGVGGANYSPSTSVTIYARWTGVSYTITYYSNGATSGTVPTAGSFTAGGSAYTVASNSGTLERTGYTFGGWDTSTAGNGTSYAVGASYNANANLNLYAKWTPIARTVTYAGTTSSGSLPAQLTNKYIGETFTVSSSTGFARSGYTFSGWSDGTNLYAAGSTYTVGSTNVTLTAQWSGISYSVTYLANGGSGSLPTQSNLSAGETFTVQSSSLARTGYSFVAWNDGTANYTPGSTYTMSGANASLIAQWTATGYTITFNGNGADGGSAPTTGRYVTGGAPYSVALNTFTKTGYNFTGWKTSAAVDYAPGAGYASTSDLVLIAQWAAKTIAISYNVNGGTGSAPGSQNWTYNPGTPATLDAGSGLTKTGYTFGGWSASASATTGATTGTPSSSLTYYAVWTPVTYTVTYATGSGTGSVPTEAGKNLGGTFTLASGSAMTPPAPTNSGATTYSFAYWNDGTSNYSAGATYVMPANNVTLTAQWIAIYNVTYNANGGVTSIASEQKTESATVTIGAAATRDGYTFGKWVAQSGDQFDPGASTSVQNNRYLFTATWTAIARSITYDINGGTGSAPTTLTGKTIGQIITLDSTTATKAGYSFGGWTINSIVYPAGASYTIGNGNVAPVAVWNAATYSISYNGNGSTSGTAPAGGTFTTGGSYTAASNTGIFAKTGFTFAGWNTTANGDGTSYAEGATNVTATADLILYAKWTAASFAVTYVANGATSALPSQSPVQFGNTFTVASAATQAGKTFTGWSDGTNTYGGGSTYTMGGSAVTLTATWANQLYAVTYSLNGGSGDIAPIQNSLSSSDSFTVQTTSATKSGYSFGGWSNGTSTYQANTTYNMSSANVTLLAIWNVAAPGTPGTPTVTPGDGNATITIAAPSSGGTPTSYTVTASPGGASCTVISPATSCTITGLTNGTSYSFSTVANNATGSSSASPSSAAVSPAGKPGVPTGVTATIGNGSATVSLTPPTNTGGPAITSYTMTASPGGATCTVNAPATSCAISPLDNGTAYTFTATAYNGVARSDSSTASSSVTPATVPGAPTITSASSSASGTTTVNFSAPASNGGSAITGYTITSNPGGFTCTAAANATSCAVSGLTDGVAYTFTAVATNAIGNSTSSGASSAVTSAGAASAPTSVTGTVGNGSSTISVSGANANGSPITGYTVQAYDSTGSAIVGKTCSITSPATSCEITGLTNGSEYTFTATATNGVGTSAASAPSASVTPAGVPSAPTGLTVTSGTGKVTVSWTAPAANGSAITSYTVQAYDEDGNSVSGATCTISAPTTACDVSSNLDPGTNYTFKIIASNAAGAGSASTASSAAAVNAAPSAPLNVTATSTNGGATVSWDAPADSRGSAVTGYTVTAYNSNNNAVGTCTATAPTQTCSATGLTNGEAYTFKVTATNGIGTSAQSTTSSAVTPSTVPGAPTNVVASAGDASASISFTAPTNTGGSPITGYTVIASNGSTVSGTSSPLTISGLTNNTAYTFSVKATNIKGDSIASASSAAATPRATFPPEQTSDAQPSGFAYVGSTLTSQVEFSGSPTPTQTYQWQVCTLPSDQSSCTDITGATSATYIPVVSDEGKYIRVEATATNTLGSNVVTSIPTLVINPEIIYSAPNSGLSGTAGSAFVLSVVAAGGVAPFAYSVSSGTLPSGVSLDPSTGQLSGTPATSGSYTFAVRATDSNTAFKTVNVTLTIEAAASPSSSSSSSSSSSTPTPTTPPACDAACQAAKDARAAADKANADANAKANAEATAKAASDKAAADKAAADAAAKAQNSAQSKAAADAAAAVQAAADAAAKAAAASAAKVEADKAAAAAAAAIKAAQAAAAARKPGSTAAATAANAAASKAAADAQAAVKAAAAAAAAATAAKKQVDISLSVSVSASAKAADSAAAQKQANAVAAAAKAAAEAAAQAVADASAARAKASQAATAAAEAQAAAVAEKKAATQAAAEAQAAAKAASLAAVAKAAADQAAQKAAAELAKALADKAAQSAKVASTTDPTAKAAAQTALAEVSKKVEELTVVATTTTQQFEAKAKEVETTLAAATEAVETAKQKSEDAAEASQEAAAKVSAATQAAKVATNTTAAATAATAVAKSLPTTVKIAPAPKPTSKSTDGNGTKATITGLKPGQKIKVTVKTK
ncbi:Listeria/Bacterioides repeat [Candidatus Nanopelagicaceae bacterium]